MPNRDHDDTPYNRSEGRFEETRYGRAEERSPYQREGSYRSSRDWDRYNPARDDHDYRGGSRFEDRSRYETRGYDSGRGYDTGRGYESRNYDTRAWEDDDRWRQQLRGNDWERGDDFAAGRGATQGYGGRSFYGSPGGYAQGNFGRSSRDNFGHFGTREPFSGQREWNRSYTRDWDRDYRGDWDRTSGRNQDEGDFGDQLRHAGHQLVSKVKRAFRGPKGYTRSDERIREDVSDQLAMQDELDPSDIEVRVENGDVTLTGSVRSRREKFRAEEIADDVGGVKDVHNQLRIGSPQQTVGTTTTATTQNTPISRNGRA